MEVKKIEKDELNTTLADKKFKVVSEQKKQGLQHWGKIIPVLTTHRMVRNKTKKRELSITEFPLF